MKIGDYFIDKFGKRHQLVSKDDLYYYSHFKEWGGEIVMYGANALTKFLIEECSYSLMVKAPV